jgi:putative acetyltransferase
MTPPGGSVTVRRAVDADATALHELSLRAIRSSAAAHYGERQLDAWTARRTVEGHRWMVQRTVVLVAVDAGTVLGFAAVALEPVGELRAGEVDQLFVAPEAGGRGVARALLTAVAATARAAGLTELVTHASWRAVPVFERLGYQRVEVETVRLDGVPLTRVLLRCAIAPDA